MTFHQVKHSQKRSGMKIGVICVRPNQTELKQMFLNGLESTLFFILRIIIMIL